MRENYAKGKSESNPPLAVLCANCQEMMEPLIRHDNNDQISLRMVPLRNENEKDSWLKSSDALFNKGYLD